MATSPACCSTNAPSAPRRGDALKSLGALTLALSGAGLGILPAARAAALKRAERDQLTPDQVIDLMQAGNERFSTGKMQPQDYLAQKRATAGGQYPAAVILSCIDSRAPAEIILDARIGDTFQDGWVDVPAIGGRVEFLA